MKKHSSTGILIILSLWLVYFFYCNLSNNPLHQGMVNLFTQAVLDLSITYLAFKIVKKISADQIIFYLIAISFVFISFSDFYYNYITTLTNNIPKTYPIDPVDFPLITFISLQTVAGFLILKKNIDNNLLRIFVDTPILVIGFSILLIYGYAFHLNSQELDPIQKIYQNISVLFEMISVFIALLCLIFSFNTGLTLLLSGYLILISGDFLARFALLHGTLVNDYMIQSIWSLGQVIYLFGLMRIYLGDLKTKISTWMLHLNSAQAKFTLWTHMITLISLILFIFISICFSKNPLIFKDYFLYNLSSVLIIFSVFSILISHTFWKELLRPFKVIKELFSDYANHKYTDLNSHFPKITNMKGSTQEFNELNKFISDSFKTLHEKILAERSFFNIASQVAHDIRSPTSALLMLAKACVEIPEKDRLILREAAISIQDIANNLLSAYGSKHNIQKELFSESRANILVSAVILQLLTEKRLQYQDKDVMFDYSFELNSSFSFIKIELSSFKRTLSNLINNAIDSFGENSGKVLIHLKVEKGELKIAIEDNGKGMAISLINKILNNMTVTEGKKEGYGIGLAQVREALKKNEGDLEIESQIGTGTKVTLIFPESSEPFWIANKIELQRNNTVIIIDDDPCIHAAWDSRFNSILKLAPLIKIKHFTQGEVVLQYLTNLPEKEKDDLFLLADHELINQNLNGLSIIEISRIKNAILVTSHYTNKTILARAAITNTKILPKLLACEIPISIAEIPSPPIVNDTCHNTDLVIVDDSHKLIKLIIDYSLKNRKVDYFQNPFEFLRNCDRYSKNTKICLDFDFGLQDINGLTLANQLYEKGYRAIYLISGMTFDKKQLPDYITLIPKHQIADIFI